MHHAEFTGATPTRLNRSSTHREQRHEQLQQLKGQQVQSFGVALSEILFSALIQKSPQRHAREAL
jgi:hypothetical protein